MEQVPGGLVVVVPTYNEAGNISDLFRLIESARLHDPFDVLIVDDGSPDGTGKVVEELAASRPWLYLLRRERPQGLGSAYRAGFHWALGRGYVRIGEMDADLSHDPRVLPDLDRTVLSGADLALGSRYVRGGGSEGWPFSRRMLSRGANLFARILLGLNTRDSTGGFRIYAANAVHLLLEQGTECDGYGFQVESVMILARRSMRIVEVPITFRERRHGQSKMSRAIVWEAIRRCFQMAREGRVPRRRPLSATPQSTSLPVPGLSSTSEGTLGVDL